MRSLSNRLHSKMKSFLLIFNTKNQFLGLLSCCHFHLFEKIDAYLTFLTPFRHIILTYDSHRAFKDIIYLRSLKSKRTNHFIRTLHIHKPDIF